VSADDMDQISGLNSGRLTGLDPDVFAYVPG
jgi:hypothetical protein